MPTGPYENLPAAGTRVMLLHDVDRYPHFLAPKGATGVVVDNTGTVPEMFAVRLDQPLDGAEEWDNEVQWILDNGDDPTGAVAPVASRAGASVDILAPSEAEATPVDCECGAGPFDSWESVLAHAQRWHPDRMPAKPPTDADLEEATNAWFGKIRAGDSDAVEEAIHLIRAHALPEEHPLAID